MGLIYLAGSNIFLYTNNDNDYFNDLVLFYTITSVKQDLYSYLRLCTLRLATSGNCLTTDIMNHIVLILQRKVELM